MQRESRSLRVYVVEPRQYGPSGHAAIFNGALNSLLGNEPIETSLDTVGFTPSRRSFDLLTFPEAFLAADDFLIAATALRGAGATGCIHTGLRPGVHERFLFTTSEAAKLLGQLIEAGVNLSDLQPFQAWLIEQTEDAYFNLGAVLAVDAGGETRVCLHAKMVRSKFELSGLSESNMTEANLLSVLTLVPSDPKLLPYTLQPLLCSDALTHDTDRPGCRPIDGLTRWGDAYDSRIPDYVDVVSLATCTPHPESGGFPRWHGDFRDAFLRTAKDDSVFRHRHAVFFLSNFHDIPGCLPGGLSGAFLPFPLKHIAPAEYVSCGIYGAIEYGLDNGWHSHGTQSLKRPLAHMVSLMRSAFPTQASAAILGFDLHRLLRESNQYYAPEGLINYERRFGISQSDGTTHFSRDKNES